MSVSTSLAAYKDCIDAMEQALDDPKGIRIALHSIDQATFFRMRIHQARKLLRKKNEDIYPDPAHPQHGASVYDTLMCKIRSEGGKAYLYLEKQEAIPGRIESLSDARLIDHKPIPRLESPEAIKRRI